MSNSTTMKLKQRAPLKTIRLEGEHGEAVHEARFNPGDVRNLNQLLATIRQIVADLPALRRRDVLLQEAVLDEGGEDEDRHFAMAADAVSSTIKMVDDLEMAIDKIFGEKTGFFLTGGSVDADAMENIQTFLEIAMPFFKSAAETRASRAKAHTAPRKSKISPRTAPQEAEASIQAVGE